MGAPKAAAATSAAKKTDTVTEFVLKQRKGDTLVPLFSDQDEDVVRAQKTRVIVEAQQGGQPRPDLVIIKRVCTYPLGAEGKRLAEGSTAEETEL